MVLTEVHITRESETEQRNMRQIKGITYDKSMGRCEHPKYQKSKLGNENKIQKSKTGEQEQDANSYRSLPGDVGRSLDQRFWKQC